MKRRGRLGILDIYSRAGKSKKKTKASAKKPKLRPYLAEIASYQVENDSGLLGFLKLNFLLTRLTRTCVPATIRCWLVSELREKQSCQTLSLTTNQSAMSTGLN